MKDKAPPKELMVLLDSRKVESTARSVGAKDGNTYRYNKPCGVDYEQKR